MVDAILWVHWNKFTWDKEERIDYAIEKLSLVIEKRKERKEQRRRKVSRHLN
jgi:hypothetical protein